MSAVGHEMGGDLLLDKNGSLAVASGATETRQKVLRRLYAVAGDYLWHQDYGAGLPRMVGDPMRAELTQGVIRAQISRESGVDTTAPVGVTVSERPDGTVNCMVSYVDAMTQDTQELVFAT